MIISKVNIGGAFRYDFKCLVIMLQREKRQLFVYIVSSKLLKMTSLSRHVRYLWDTCEIYWRCLSVQRPPSKSQLDMAKKYEVAECAPMKCCITCSWIVTLCAHGQLKHEFWNSQCVLMIYNSPRSCYVVGISLIVIANLQFVERERTHGSTMLNSMKHERHFSQSYWPFVLRTSNNNFACTNTHSCDFYMLTYFNLTWNSMFARI